MRQAIKEQSVVIHTEGSVDETIDASNYNFTIKYNNTPTTQSFEFKKISSTQIQWKNTGNNVWYDLFKL